MSSSNFYSVLWIPYFFLLYRLYTRRSIWTVIVLVCVGLLDYRLPVLGQLPRIETIGALFCMGIAVAGAPASGFWRQLRAGCDPIIFKAVVIYFVLIFVSAFIYSEADLADRIIGAVDYSLLFFVAITCIKSEKDIQTLLKGIVLGVFLMVAVGMVGYLLDDPWWGHTIDTEAKQLAHAMPELSYAERLLEQDWLARNRQIAAGYQRARFTSSDPNSLGTTILLAVPLLVYFWFKAKHPRHKLMIAGVLFLLMAGIYLSASRTVVLAGSFVFLVVIIMLFRTKRLGIHQVIVAVFVIVAVMTSSFFVGNFGRTTSVRIGQITSLDDLIDASGRMARWKYHISKLTPSLLVIGTGRIGAQGDEFESKQAHMNYLSTIYRGGFLSLVAFLVCLLKSMRNAHLMSDPAMRICLFASLLAFAAVGITQESGSALGPNYVFWPLIAIAAKPAGDRFPTSGPTRRDGLLIPQHEVVAQF